MNTANDGGVGEQPSCSPAESRGSLVHRLCAPPTLSGGCRLSSACPMMFLILTGLVWAVVLFKRGAFSPGLPLGYRIPLILLSFLLLWDACYPVQLFIRGVFHPIVFFDHIYTGSGIFSPSASLVITLLSCAAGWIKYVLGFRLAEQRRVAHLLGSRAAPFLFLANVLYAWHRSQKYLHGTPGDYFLYGMVLVLLGAEYIWLYSFCKNPRNQELLNKTSERKKKALAD